MRVLIINCNRERKPQTLIPLGACSIASAAEAAGYETHFLDLTFSAMPLRSVRTAVQRLHPDVIGLSIRNLDNCDAVSQYNYLPDVRRIAASCRQHADAVLVLGGAAVSLAPVPMLRYLGGDYAVVGEGEHVFITLLHAIEQGSDTAMIPGVVSTHEPTALQPNSSPIADLHALPDVDYSRWISLRKYRAADTAYPIQTKRGCRFHCSYCRYPFLEGHHWRLRDPAWVAEEIARATASGLRTIEFVDSVFGLPTAHAVECCDAISRLPRTGALCTMELTPAACTPELIHAMNAARFSSVAITAESGSDAMLAQLQKGFRSDELQHAAQVLRALHAHKLWIFMIGAPGECEKTVRETACFIATLPATDLVYVTFGVRVLPGTALQQTLIASGELQADDALLGPSFYHSPSITPSRAQAMLRDSGFPSLHFVTIHDSVHWLLPTVQRAMAFMGVSPPYWRHIPDLNRLRRLIRL